MELSVGVLNRSDDTLLVSFLNQLGEKFEQVLGYHYPFYRDMLENIGIGDSLYIAVKNNKGELSAVLPGFIKTQPEGTVYSSLPFFGPNSGILCDYSSAEKEKYYTLIFDFLLKHLSGFKMLSASFYTPFNTESETDLFKKMLPAAQAMEKFTSFIPLEKFELSTEHVDSSGLRNVRKAKKSGVSIRTEVNTDEIEQIYSIYLQNCKDYNIPVKPRGTLDFLLKDPSAKDHVKTYLAEFEGKLIGALIMIYSPKTASYYIPCNLHEYRNLQPNALLIATAIEDAKKTGRAYWNWESSPSKESGVYQFKKKWGSVDSHYSIFIKTYQDKSYFNTLGQANISKLYPFYFVYPFHLL